MPVYGIEDATLQHRAGGKTVPHVLPDTLGTCVWHQGACSFSGKKPQLGGSAERHDGHPWRTRSVPRGF